MKRVLKRTYYVLIKMLFVYVCFISCSVKENEIITTL